MNDNRNISSAMKRFRVDDQYNEFYTLFRYRPVSGLGYEEGIGRRDPSNIIKVGDTYYIWYTRIEGDRPSGWDQEDSEVRNSPWDLADLWYATSQDGDHWVEQGCAVKRGAPGTYDYRSVFTCNIMVHEGRYYLCYQTLPDRENKPGVVNAVGLSVADSPEGPWKKMNEPILTTGTYNAPIPEDIMKKNDWYEANKYIAWDSLAVHDPQILKRDGKFWLYYKGHPREGSLLGEYGWQGKQGVAVADHPEGPYVKSELNPIANSGHEIWMWPYKDGVASIVDWCGPEKNTIQFSRDGLNFDIVSSLNDIPPAGGAYVPDLFDEPENGMGFNWGLCHYSDKRYWNFLVRFDCDLMQGEEKTLVDPYAYHTYAKVMPVTMDINKYLDK